MQMKFDVMTLFPDMVKGVLSESIIGRAQSGGLIEVDCHNIRDFSVDKHRKTDDTPYGGGVGMVMTCQPIYDCYESLVKNIPEQNKKRVIYMSPKGQIFSHDKAKELSEYDNLIFLCGHYEGVDQRVLDLIVDEEISIGDYVLTGGELPACILVDSVSRMLEGVLSSPECFENESIAGGLLEYPQYTRPVEFHGVRVPEVLLSGHHAKIEEWRLEESLALTKERRPEMYEAYILAHPPKVKKQRRKKAPVESD